MREFEFHEKIYPTQDVTLELFRGKRAGVERRAYELALYYSNTQNSDSSFIFPPEFPGQQYMGCDCLFRKLIEFILKMLKAHNALEIGTFVGMTTIHIASHISGRVDSIEKYERFANMARQNFALAGSKNIELFNADASNLFASENSLLKNYDFIFLDGHKEAYKDYFLVVKDYLNSGGILCIDDAYFMGDLLNAEPLSPKGRGVKECLEAIKSSPEFETLLLPMQYGLFLARKI